MTTAFQELISFFGQISVLSAKKPDILSLARKYLTHKKDWGPTKKFPGPPAPQGPGAICPLCPPPLCGPGHSITCMLPNFTCMLIVVPEILVMSSKIVAACAIIIV